MDQQKDKMAKPTARGMTAYSVHGHIQPGSNAEELLDYSDFFRELGDRDLRELRFAVGGDTVAIAEFSSKHGRYAFQFVSGNAQALPLVYDPTTATAQQVDPGEGRFVVSSAWVIVDAARRIAVVERKRPGVPMFQIEEFLSLFGRQLGLTRLTISLNPVPTESFAREIRELTRIREGSITLRRPNHSWTRTAEGMLKEAGASNAAEISVQLNADRGQSLSKSAGIVRDVLDLASRPISALKNAVVRGKSPKFDGEKAVSLKNHVVRGTVQIDENDGPLRQLESLDGLASDLIEEAVGDELLEESLIQAPSQLSLDPGAEDDIK